MAKMRSALLIHPFYQPLSDEAIGRTNLGTERQATAPSLRQGLQIATLGSENGIGDALGTSAAAGVYFS